MWAKVHSVFTVFSALVLVVSSVEAGLSPVLPAPYNVSVTCDSYGVVLDWEASGLSMEAHFLLELVPDHGNRTTRITGRRHINVSAELQDAAFNRYVVRVKARDGTGESEATPSPIFSYNHLATADIICYLEFPAIHLSPGDNQLIVRFISPLHLYGHTPALRNLTTSKKKLIYQVTSSREGGNGSDVTFTCIPESDMCECSVMFGEEQEEYCVTLSGEINQTPLRKTEPLCYRGRLRPSPSVKVYLIPVMVSVAVISAVLLLKLCLQKAIKKKNLTKFPKILENKLKFKHLNTILKMETDPVVENPVVEPDIATSLKSDLPDSTVLLETLANSTQHLDNYSSLISENNTGKDSGSWDPIEKYGIETTSSFASDYDCPHRIEMSPGDFVDSYGPRDTL
ncbi:interferon gamma receptor 1 [Brachyhypopomus gauderio]|uniref:interferon gamma receptor 1 n=1 Tax=Brachyhypopomus gauderio TaxID=698409 RepID=UPI004041227C